MEFHQAFSISGEAKFDQLIDRIEIPQALGTIHQIHRADPSGSDPSEMPQLILNIQDAHGQLAAQRNIEAILSYLHEHYGLDTLFIEGGLKGKISHDLLRFFRDDEINYQIAERLLAEGAIGGPEVFLLKSRDKVKAFGTEDAPLYRENLFAFRKVYSQKKAADQFLSALKRTMIDFGSHYFSAPLKRFLKEWLAFQDSKEGALSHLETLRTFADDYLSLDLTDPVSQIEYPQLVRFFKLRELADSVERTAYREHLDGEIQKLLKWIEEKHLKSSYLETFKSILQTERYTPDAGFPDVRTFLEGFHEKAHAAGFTFQDYPHLTRHLGYLLLSQEIRPDALFGEIKLLTGRILETLTVSETERDLVRLLRDYMLLKKFFALELTRPESEMFSSRREQLSPRRIRGRLLAFNNQRVRSRLELPDPLEEVFEEAGRFYELARAREAVMFRNLIDSLKSEKTHGAMLISGGFHSEGLESLMIEHGVSIITISPKIDVIQDHQTYLDHMMLRGSGGAGASTIRLPSVGTHPLSELRKKISEPDARYQADLLAEVFSSYGRSDFGPAFDAHGIPYPSHSRSELRRGSRGSVREPTRGRDGISGSVSSRGGLSKSGRSDKTRLLLQEHQASPLPIGASFSHSLRNSSSLLGQISQAAVKAINNIIMTASLIFKAVPQKISLTTKALIDRLNAAIKPFATRFRRFAPKSLFIADPDANTRLLNSQLLYSDSSYVLRRRHFLMVGAAGALGVCAEGCFPASQEPRIITPKAQANRPAQAADLPPKTLGYWPHGNIDFKITSGNAFVFKPSQGTLNLRLPEAIDVGKRPVIAFDYSAGDPFVRLGIQIYNVHDRALFFDQSSNKRVLPLILPGTKGERRTAFLDISGRFYWPWRNTDSDVISIIDPQASFTLYGFQLLSTDEAKIPRLSAAARSELRNSGISRRHFLKFGALAALSTLPFTHQAAWAEGAAGDIYLFFRPHGAAADFEAVQDKLQKFIDEKTAEGRNVVFFVEGVRKIDPTLRLIWNALGQMGGHMRNQLDLEPEFYNTVFGGTVRDSNGFKTLLLERRDEVLRNAKFYGWLSSALTAIVKSIETRLWNSPEALRREAERPVEAQAPDGPYEKAILRFLAKPENLARISGSQIPNAKGTLRVRLEMFTDFYDWFDFRRSFEAYSGDTVETSRLVSLYRHKASERGLELASPQKALEGVKRAVSEARKLAEDHYHSSARRDRAFVTLLENELKLSDAQKAAGEKAAAATARGTLHAGPLLALLEESEILKEISIQDDTEGVSLQALDGDGRKAWLNKMYSMRAGMPTYEQYFRESYGESFDENERAYFAALDVLVQALRAFIGYAASESRLAEGGQDALLKTILERARARAPEENSPGAIYQILKTIRSGRVAAAKFPDADPLKRSLRFLLAPVYYGLEKNHLIEPEEAKSLAGEAYYNFLFTFTGRVERGIENASRKRSELRTPQSVGALRAADLGVRDQKPADVFWRAELRARWLRLDLSGDVNPAFSHPELPGMVTPEGLRPPKPPVQRSELRQELPEFGFVALPDESRPNILEFKSHREYGFFERDESGRIRMLAERGKYQNYLETQRLKAAIQFQKTYAARSSIDLSNVDLKVSTRQAIEDIKRGILFATEEDKVLLAGMTPDEYRAYLAGGGESSDLRQIEFSSDKLPVEFKVGTPQRWPKKLPKFVQGALFQMGLGYTWRHLRVERTGTASVVLKEASNLASDDLAGDRHEGPGLTAWHVIQPEAAGIEIDDRENRVILRLDPGRRIAIPGRSELRSGKRRRPAKPHTRLFTLAYHLVDSTLANLALYRVVVWPRVRSIHELETQTKHKTRTWHSEENPMVVGETMSSFKGHDLRVKKIARAVQILRERGAHLAEQGFTHAGRTLLKRAARLDKTAIIYFPEMDTHFFYWDLKNRVYSPTTPSRRRALTHLSMKFLDALSIDSDLDMGVLAILLNNDRRFMDLFQEMKAKNATPEQAHDALVQDSEILIEPGFLISVEQFEEKLRELAIEDEEVLRKQTLPQLRDDSRKIEREWRAFKANRYRFTHAYIQKLTDFARAFSLLGSRWQSRSKTKRAKGASKHEQFYRRAIEIYHELQTIEEGPQPITIQMEEVIYFLLIRGMYDDFLEELEVLLHGNFPGEILKREPEQLRFILSGSTLDTFENDLMYVLAQHLSVTHHWKSKKKVKDTQVKAQELFRAYRSAHKLPRPQPVIPEIDPNRKSELRSEAPSQDDGGWNVDGWIQSPFVKEVDELWHSLVSENTGKVNKIIAGFERRNALVDWRLITKENTENVDNGDALETMGAAENLWAGTREQLSKLSYQGPESYYNALLRKSLLVKLVLQNIYQHVLSNGGMGLVITLAHDRNNLAENPELWTFVIDSGPGMDIETFMTGNYPEGWAPKGKGQALKDMLKNPLGHYPDDWIYASGDKMWHKMSGKFEKPPFQTPEKGVLFGLHMPARSELRSVMPGNEDSRYIQQAREIEKQRELVLDSSADPKERRQALAGLTRRAVDKTDSAVSYDALVPLYIGMMRADVEAHNRAHAAAQFAPLFLHLMESENRTWVAETLIRMVRGENEINPKVRAAAAYALGTIISRENTPHKKKEAELEDVITSARTALEQAAGERLNSPDVIAAAVHALQIISGSLSPSGTPRSELREADLNALYEKIPEARRGRSHFTKKQKKEIEAALGAMQKLLALAGPYEAPSEAEIFNAIVDTNLIESYRLEHSLPPTFVFRGDVFKNYHHERRPVFIAVTFGADFIASTAAFSDLKDYMEFEIWKTKNRLSRTFDMLRFQIAKGGARWYQEGSKELGLISFDEKIEGVDDIRPDGTRRKTKHFLTENVDLARGMSDKNAPADVMFEGGKTVFLAREGAGKKQVIEHWTASSITAGVLGRLYLAGPDMYTDDVMGIMQRKADEVHEALGLHKMRVTTSIAEDEEPASFNHKKWTVTSISVVEVMLTVLRDAELLKLYDFESKTAIDVVIQGFGDVGIGVIRYLKDQYPEWLVQSGGPLRIVGISKSNGGIYDPGGLDLGELFRLSRRRDELTAQGKDLDLFEAYGTGPDGKKKGNLRKGLKRIERGEEVFYARELDQKSPSLPPPLIAIPAANPGVFKAPNEIERLNASGIKMIVSGGNNVLKEDAGLELHLENNKILYFDGSFVSFGGIYTSAEEVFHVTTEDLEFVRRRKLEDPDYYRIHVQDGVADLSVSLAQWLFEKLKQAKRDGNYTTISDIHRDLAARIRKRKNDLLKNPSFDLEKRIDHVLGHIVAKRTPREKERLGLGDEAGYELPAELKDWIALSTILGQTTEVARAQVMYDRDPARIQTLIERLGPENALLVRRNAVYELGRINAAGAAEKILKILKNKKENDRIRANAAEALAILEYGAAYYALIAASDEKGQPHLNAWARWALNRNFKSIGRAELRQAAGSLGARPDILDRSVRSLQIHSDPLFNARLQNALVRGGVTTARDLTMRSEKDLFGIQGVRDKSVSEIKNFLARHRLMLKDSVPAEEELPLRNGLKKVLRGNGISTVSDLAARSKKDLQRLKGVGASYISEIENFLTQRGLALRDEPRPRQKQSADRPTRPQTGSKAQAAVRKSGQPVQSKKSLDDLSDQKIFDAYFAVFSSKKRRPSLKQAALELSRVHQITVSQEALGQRVGGPRFQKFLKSNPEFVQKLREHHANFLTKILSTITNTQEALELTEVQEAMESLQNQGLNAKLTVEGGGVLLEVKPPEDLKSASQGAQDRWLFGSLPVDEAVLQIQKALGRTVESQIRRSELRAGDDYGDELVLILTEKWKHAFLDSKTYAGELLFLDLNLPDPSDLERTSERFVYNIKFLKDDPLIRIRHLGWFWPDGERSKEYTPRSEQQNASRPGIAVDGYFRLEHKDGGLLITRLVPRNHAVGEIAVGIERGRPNQPIRSELRQSEYAEIYPEQPSLASALSVAREVAQNILREQEVTRFGIRIVRTLIPDAFAGSPALEQTRLENISALASSVAGFVDLSAEDPVFAGRDGEARFADLARILLRLKDQAGHPWLTISGRGALDLKDAAVKAGVEPADLMKVVRFSSSAFEEAALADGLGRGAAILAPSAESAGKLAGSLLFLNDAAGFNELDHAEQVTTIFSLVIALSRLSARMKGVGTDDPEGFETLLKNYFAREMPGFSLDSKEGFHSIALAKFWTYLENLPAVRQALQTAA